MDRLHKIFYGAGREAAYKLPVWEAKGISPTCFTDADQSKHYTKFMDIYGDYTPYNILPLQEAINKYPDYLLYISLTKSSWRDITDYLIGAGIPQDKIRYTEPVEWRKGCAHLGTFMNNDANLRICLSPLLLEGLHCGISDNIEDNFTNYFDNVTKRINELKSEQLTSCEGCIHLKYDFWNTQTPKINTLFFGSVHDDFCNFKCLYCGKHLKNNHEALRQRAKKIIETIKHYCKTTINGTVMFANGEPLLSFTNGEFDEIINLIKSNGLRMHIATNASIYSEAMAGSLKEGFGSIVVSIDAGTQKTFAKVKGNDCFEKVVDNIAQYAGIAPGAVFIKYILVEGENDNEYDIDNFILIHDKLNLSTPAALSFAMDFENCTAPLPLPEHSLTIATYFIRLCKEKQKTYSIVYDYLHLKDVAYLQQACETEYDE
ncbi:MAG: radical SAM protein [Defluviitaleaceae bacterium]|nr:radical SAM protein [Defluviitaleaceae bacterium]